MRMMPNVRECRRASGAFDVSKINGCFKESTDKRVINQALRISKPCDCYVDFKSRLDEYFRNWCLSNKPSEFRMLRALDKNEDFLGKK